VYGFLRKKWEESEVEKLWLVGDQGVLIVKEGWGMKGRGEGEEWVCERWWRDGDSWYAAPWEHRLEACATFWRHAGRAALRKRQVPSEGFAHFLVGEGDFQEGGADGVVAEFLVEGDGGLAGVEFNFGEVLIAGELFGEAHEVATDALAAMEFGDGHLAEVELIGVRRDE
jgi:hypothetical protein